MAPPLPPGDAPELPRKSTLAMLFEQHRLLESVQWLYQCTPEKVEAEITQAFATVPWAPSAFLQCVGLGLRLPRAPVANWIETATGCIMNAAHPQIWDADCWVAGTLLPGIQHLSAKLVADFAVAYRVKEEALRSFSLHLLNARLGWAVQFVKSLGMKDLLPAQLVLEAVVKRKDYTAGDAFVQGDPESERLFVQLLIDSKAVDKVIKKRLTLFKLSPKDFPVYFEQKQQATLCFLIRMSEFEKALQFVQGSEYLTFSACRMIIKHFGARNAATKQFVYRSGLAQNFPEVDISQEAGKPFADKDDLAPLASCLSIVDAIGEDAIAFVDTPSALQDCANYLGRQSVIGFDAEWKPILGPSDGAAPCALVQLASREKAFVVDVIALHEHGRILAPVFRSHAVLKLGYGAQNDVRVLRPFLANDDGADDVMSMLVDLQAVTKKLPTPRRAATSSKRGLAALAEGYLGSPLDKRVRMSNWERRPLTRAQLHYAALDAHVLLQIYDKMQEQHSVDRFEAAVACCTEKYVK